MSINYITLSDIQKGKHNKNNFVVIKCKNCDNEQLIGNHIEWIKDHIREPNRCPLHRCSICNVETRLKESELEKIKKVLK